MKMTSLLQCAALAIATSTAISASAAVIYSGVFPGNSTTVLNGSIPAVADNTGGEIGASPSWIAATTNNDFKANGSINNAASFYAAAYLPFVPNVNQVYTLSATLNRTSTTGTGFLAIGFTETSAVPTATGGRMLDSAASATPGSVGHGWMMHRGGGYNGSTFDQRFLGPGTGGSANIPAPLGQTTHAVDVQMVLDTTPALWTITWLMRDHNNPSDPFTVVGGPLALGATNPTLNYIGLNVANGVAGQVSDFTLSVPEPVSALLLLPLALARRARGRKV